ncbi:MAG: hypothetical protein ACOX4Q_10150 [Syntrophomonadales bacterium]
MECTSQSRHRPDSGRTPDTGLAEKPGRPAGPSRHNHPGKLDRDPAADGGAARRYHILNLRRKARPLRGAAHHHDRQRVAATTWCTVC